MTIRGDEPIDLSTDEVCRLYDELGDDDHRRLFDARTQADTAKLKAAYARVRSIVFYAERRKAPRQVKAVAVSSKSCIRHSFADEIVEVCESPIEIGFLTELLVIAFPSADAVRSAGTLRGGLRLGELGMLFIQYPIYGFSLDFAIVGLNYKLDIELDGHEFHAKTKDQVARDYYRDRRLQADKWHVFRFTGREVYGDPVSCVWETLRAAYTFAGLKPPQLLI